MIGDLVEMNHCDTLVISGGMNEAKALDDVELARQPIRDLINTAQHRANNVIIMPPPPIQHPKTKSYVKRISDILWYEAQQAVVEFVDMTNAF